MTSCSSTALLSICTNCSYSFSSVSSDNASEGLGARILARISAMFEGSQREVSSGYKNDGRNAPWSIRWPLGCRSYTIVLSTFVVGDDEVLYVGVEGGRFDLGSGFVAGAIE